MKTIGVSSRQFSHGLAGLLVGLSIIPPALAVEVASPANRFPSPTGVYKAVSSEPISFSNGVQCHCTHLRMANGSAPPPAAGAPLMQTLECLLDVSISTDGGTTFSWATFPSSLVVRMSPNAGGPGSYDTEILSLNINGALPGGVMIRESPTLQSTGQHTVRQVPSGTFYVDSFFDIFLEVSLDSASWWPMAAQGHRLVLREPGILEVATHALPPADAVPVCAADLVYPNNVVMRNVRLGSPSSSQSPPDGALAYVGPCDANDATGELSLDGGTTFTPWRGNCTGTCRYTLIRNDGGIRFFDTEMLSMTLSGGTLPASVRVRESPSKASLGRVTVRQAPGGGYRTSGFFDIFTEVSLTNGASWTPATGQAVQAQYNPKEVGVDKSVPWFASNLFPPPMAVFKTVGGLSAIVPGKIEWPNGTVARGLKFSLSNGSLPPPALGQPPQDQTVQCMVQMEVSNDGGLHFEAQQFPGEVVVRIRPRDQLQAGDPQLSFDTEMLALSVGDPVGGFMLRESPTRASLGRHTVRAAPDGSFFMSSFFDVFTELSLDGGTSWSAAPSCHSELDASKSEVTAPIPNFPPEACVLACQTDLVFPNGVVMRLRKVHGLHHGDAPPAPGGTQMHGFDGTASGEISLDGGLSFAGWSGACTGTCRLTSYLDDGGARYFDTEMISLNLSGGTLPQGVMIRESPTRASLGRTSIRTTPNTSFGTVSFFDVFTELSIDGGNTWTPASGNPSEFAFEPPPRENFYAIDRLPLPGEYETDPNAAPVMFPNGVALSRLRKRPEILFQAWEDSSSLHLQPLGGGISIHASTDGGATFEEVRGSYTYEVSVSEAVSSGSDTERAMEIHSLTCTFVKGGAQIMIRESPTLPSLGKTTARTMGGGYMIDSFFDIFTEVSIDGGATWVPGSSPMHVSLLPYLEQENVFRTTFFPPRNGSFAARPFSETLSYSSGAVINNMRVRLNQLESRSQPLPTTPAPQTQTTACVVECDLSLDGGQTWTHASVPAESSLRVQANTSHVNVFDTEMLALSASGGALPAGVMIRESPTRASTGRVQLTSRIMEEEGIYYTIDSFFDVFTELSLDGGATWSPANSACRLLLAVDSSGSMNRSNWQPLVALHRASDPGFELLFEGTPVTLSNVALGRAIPSSIIPGGTMPPPVAGQINRRQCSCPLGSKVTGLSASGVAEPGVANAYLTWEFTDVMVDSIQMTMTTEVVALNVSGGTLPPGMMLRESPTLRSTGKTTLRTMPDGYRIHSFFDVFTELSLDGGQTWHAACAPLHMVSVDTSPDHPAESLKLAPPQNLTVHAMEIPPRSSSGKRVESIQFGNFIDSAVNFIDDRHLLGLKVYDTSLAYSVGDSAVYNRYTCQTNFGYAIARNMDDISDGTYRIEVTTFDMQGGTLPQGVRLRKSPLMPALGVVTDNKHPDGRYRTSGFFDVFTEISADNGATWELLDQPFHIELEDRSVSLLTHSDQFIPEGVFVQRGNPVRCPDGTCADIAIAFTSPAAPVPTDGTPVTYTPANGTGDAVVTLPGVAAATATFPVSAQFSLTLSHTIGDTRYFDAELLSLDFSGGSLPAGFRLRESPTKASLGRHTITNAGGGDHRVMSFFDVFTEISLDDGQTWSASDGTTRLELSAPEIAVQSPQGVGLTDGSSSINFGVALSGTSVTRTVTIKNSGSLTLRELALSVTGPNSGAFSVPAGPLPPIAPQTEASFTATFLAGGSGPRNAVLHIASDDSDENTFDIGLTGRVLAPDLDDDGDGLTNLAEVNLIDCGFDPLSSSSALLTFMRDNGLYRTSDVQALNMDVPLLTRNPATGEFKLTFGLEKSTDLGGFTPFPLNPPQTTINAQGKLEFLFTVPDTAAFFRVQAP